MLVCSYCGAQPRWTCLGATLTITYSPPPLSVVLDWPPMGGGLESPAPTMDRAAAYASPLDIVRQPSFLSKVPTRANTICHKSCACNAQAKPRQSALLTMGPACFERVPTEDGHFRQQGTTQLFVAYDRECKG